MNYLKMLIEAGRESKMSFVVWTWNIFYALSLFPNDTLSLLTSF